MSYLHEHNQRYRCMHFGFSLRIKLSHVFIFLALSGLGPVGRFYTLMGYKLVYQSLLFRFNLSAR